jgi:septal ring factor EnvC (AmiA/AmiB activator)
VTTAAWRRDPLAVISVGVAVAALVATVAGLALVQRLGTTYRDALDVTVETADLAAGVAEQAVALPDTLVQLTRQLNAVLDQVRELTEVAAASGTDLADALGTNVALTVEGTAAVADRAAALIETIERFIPGDSESLAEDLRNVADGLAPVPDQLRDLADQLDQGAAALAATVDDLDALDAQLSRLAVDITTAAGSLADVPRLATELQADARAARDRVEGDLWLLRVIVVASGAAVGLVALGFWRVQRRLPPPDGAPTEI